MTTVLDGACATILIPPEAFVDRRALYGLSTDTQTLQAIVMEHFDRFEDNSYDWVAHPGPILTAMPGTTAASWIGTYTLPARDSLTIVERFQQIIDFGGVPA